MGNNGGTWFERLASIPSRRLWGAGYGQGGGDRSGDRRAPDERTRGTQASSTAATMTLRDGGGTGGWNAYASLPAGLKPAVDNPAAMVVGANQAIASQWPDPVQTRKAIEMLNTNPRIASQVSTAMQPFLMRHDYGAAGGAAARVVRAAFEAGELV